MSGESFGYLFERLFEQPGVLDAYYTPVYMKKNRPGYLLTVLTTVAAAETLECFILKESTTFGVRKSRYQRRILAREIRTLATPWGLVRYKIGRLDQEILKITPEYEDVRQICREQQGLFSELYADIQQYGQTQIKLES